MGSINLRMNLKTRLYPTARTLQAMERLLTNSDGTQYLPLAIPPICWWRAVPGARFPNMWPKAST